MFSSEYRKYVSNSLLSPKHITCCVSIFNLYRMSIYYLHTDTQSYVAVHIHNSIEAVFLYRYWVYCKYVSKFVLLFYSETYFKHFFKTQQLFFTFL